MTWTLFTLFMAVAAYVSNDTWPRRVIGFLVVWGAITLWALHRIEKGKHQLTPEKRD